MHGTFGTGQPTRGRVALDISAAARQLDALGAPDPLVLAYHPVSASNPYQTLLYGRAWAHGIAPVPLHRIERLAEVPPPDRLGTRVALHLHWTNKIIGGSASEAEADDRIGAFVDRIDAFVRTGGALVWTVHNAIPHGERLEAAEARLQQAIVDRATVVHTLAARTVELVADRFTIPPERVLHVPHPTYAGAYPDLIGRDEARYRLGIDADAIVYAAVGEIRAHKGIDLLLDAFDALSVSDDRPRRLIVAGPAGGEPEVAAFLARAATHPFVWLAAERIPDDRIGMLLRAADIAVLPYRRSLNSGALLLALTFGLPVVAAATGATSDIVTPAIGRLFEPGDAAGFLTALRSADGLLDPVARDAVAAVARAHDPVALSDRFHEELGARVRTLVLP